MDRDEKLMQLYRRVYSSPVDVMRWKFLERVATVYVGASFVIMLLKLIVKYDWIECLKFAVAAAIPFVVVSVARFFINAERPYEYFDFERFKFAPFDKMRESRRPGKSFPSRHVFSAFLIGTLAMTCSIPVGISVLVLGAFIAVVRVMLGIHFVRDVLVGGIVGILSGLVGMMIL